MDMITILNMTANSAPHADDFIIGDLRDPALCDSLLDRRFDEIYQLAADMGGAGFVFSGDNDADIRARYREGLVTFYRPDGVALADPRPSICRLSTVRADPPVYPAALPD